MNERSADIEDRLLEGTLKAVRRKRQEQHILRSVIAALILSLPLLWLTKDPSSKTPIPANRFVASTDSNTFVQTKALPERDRIATQSGKVDRVQSMHDTSLTLTTVRSPKVYQVLSDEDLKKLLAVHDPVIIRQNNHRALLVMDGKLMTEPF